MKYLEQNTIEIKQITIKLNVKKAVDIYDLALLIFPLAKDDEIFVINVEPIPKFTKLSQLEKEYIVINKP